MLAEIRETKAVGSNEGKPNRTKCPLCKKMIVKESFGAHLTWHQEHKGERLLTVDEDDIKDTTFGGEGRPRFLVLMGQ